MAVIGSFECDAGLYASNISFMPSIGVLTAASETVPVIIIVPVPSVSVRYGSSTEVHEQKAAIESSQNVIMFSNFCIPV